MIIMDTLEFQSFESELGELYKGRYTATLLNENTYAVDIADLKSWEGYAIGKIVQMQVQLNNLNQLDKINK